MRHPKWWFFIQKSNVSFATKMHNGFQLFLANKPETISPIAFIPFISFFIRKNLLPLVLVWGTGCWRWSPMSWACGARMGGKFISLLNFGLVENYLAADEFMQSDTTGLQRHVNALSLMHCQMAADWTHVPLQFVKFMALSFLCNPYVSVCKRISVLCALHCTHLGRHPESYPRILH